MEMVLKDVEFILGNFGDHLGPVCGSILKIGAEQSCDNSKQPQEEQNSDEDSFET